MCELREVLDMSGDMSYCKHCGWPESMHTDCEKGESPHMDITGEFDYSFNECPEFEQDGDK